MATARDSAAEKTAARITIEKPGAMTEKGRRDIARWMRDRADDLEQLGDELNATGKFVCRYMYLPEGHL